MYHFWGQQMCRSPYIYIYIYMVDFPLEKQINLVPESPKQRALENAPLEALIPVPTVRQRQASGTQSQTRKMGQKIVSDSSHRSRDSICYRSIESRNPWFESCESRHLSFLATTTTRDYTFKRKGSWVPNNAW